MKKEVLVVSLKDPKYQAYKLFFVKEDGKLTDIFDPKGNMGTGLGPRRPITYFKDKGYTISKQEIANHDEFISLIKKGIANSKLLLKEELWMQSGKSLKSYMVKKL